MFGHLVTWTKFVFVCVQSWLQLSGFSLDTSLSHNGLCDTEKFYVQ